MDEISSDILHAKLNASSCLVDRQEQDGVHDDAHEVSLEDAPHKPQYIFASASDIDAPTSHDNWHPLMLDLNNVPDVVKPPRKQDKHDYNQNRKGNVLDSLHKGHPNTLLQTNLLAVWLYNRSCTSLKVLLKGHVLVKPKHFREILSKVMLSFSDQLVAVVDTNHSQ